MSAGHKDRCLIYSVSQIIDLRGGTMKNAFQWDHKKIFEMNVIQNSNQIEYMFYGREYMMDQTNTHQIDVNLEALEEPSAELGIFISKRHT